MFDADVAEPHMRQLLDTAAAGHAAIWLLEHGLADAETVGAFITPAVIVDILSDSSTIRSACASSSSPAMILRPCWSSSGATGTRDPAVLDALGQHLPDRALAKQARKAAMRHRSWIANGGTSSR